MPSLGGRFSGLARSVLDPAFTPGWAATPLLLEGRSRSFSNSGFSQRRPGAWLKPVFEKPAKVLAIIGKRIFLDFRRPATGHANLVSGVGSAEMDRSSG